LLNVFFQGPGTASIGDGGQSTWIISDEEMEEVQIIQGSRKAKTISTGKEEGEN
jgi:hypothetical protein